MTKKEATKRITELIDDPMKFNYKRRAYVELEEIENLTRKKFPSIDFVLSTYPDFNNVCLEVSHPDHVIFRIYINPDDYLNLPPKEKKKAIEQLAGWMVDMEKGKWK